MRIEVQSLVLEVTRRCNMACDHCLRGDAQCLDMDRKIIRQLLDKVDSINEVTFSGGEPTLNLPLIECFFEEAEKRGKLPGSFYVVTNGSVNQYELAVLLLKWFPKMDEPDYCGVTISRDIFHDEVDGPNYLSGLAFYEANTKTWIGADGSAWLINEDRAYDNGIGERTPQDTGFRVESYGETVGVEMLYVGANGMCIGDCDRSYKTVDEEGVSIGRLKTHLAHLARDTAA